MTKSDENEALVKRYLEARANGDKEVWAACMADDITRYLPRPTNGLEPIVGKANQFKDAVFNVYQPGSFTREFENIVSNETMVSIQCIVRAITIKGEPYESYYHHLYECENGKIKTEWEYIDTLYAQKMHFSND